MSLLYICLEDGSWLFYGSTVQEEVDAPPLMCPQCKKSMHRVDGLERLMLRDERIQELEEENKQLEQEVDRWVRNSW